MNARVSVRLLFVVAALAVIGCVEGPEPEATSAPSSVTMEPGMAVTVPATPMQAVAPWANVPLTALRARPGDGVRFDPSAVLQVVSLDLRTALGVDEVLPVGVTLEPSTGRLLVLDAEHGLFAIDEAGQATRVWTMDLASYPVEIGSALTDVVSVAPGFFALTAISDGFLWQEASDLLMRHFCFEPGDEQGLWDPNQLQLAQAVTYDEAGERIFAQPQTFMIEAPDVPVSSWIASYDRTTGADLQWWWIEDPAYVAGGMAMLGSGDALMLGAGTRLERFDLETAVRTSLIDLSAIGVRHIEGLAIDTAHDHVFVIDGPTGRLLRLSLSSLPR